MRPAFALLALVSWLAASEVRGQSAAAPDAAHAVDPLALAEVLIAQHRSAEARKILEQLERDRSHDRARANQTLFLLGLLDLEAKDYASAIARFRRILVTEPNQIRVRLELGRAFFLERDYADAERQFLFARAGRLPKAVRDNIDQYLGAVRALKTFGASLSVALATDTNLNAGPATDSISLYGVPFQLSPQAKANAGVGLALDGSAEWSPRLEGPLKWRLGSQLHRSQYGSTGFDDMTLNLYSGPHVTWKRWDLNLLGNVARRWYGDQTYFDLFGLSPDATFYATSRLGVGVGLNFNRFGYARNPLQTGDGLSVALNAFYTLSPSDIVRGSVSLGVQDARIPAYASHVQQYGLSYSREFPGGLTIALAPAYTHIGYQAPLAAFANRRDDHQVSAQASILDRRIDWDGFTPRLTYTFTRNASTLPLYAFRRSRIELGVTRAF